MKSGLFLVVIVFFALAGCRNDDEVADSGRFMETRNQDNSYSVIYVNTGNESDKTARKRALTRAAELTVDNGYRYFHVASESSVTVASTNDDPSQDEANFPSNIDEELIVEKNFSRRSIESRTSPSSQYYPAYKIVFHISEDEKQGNALDACNYVACEK
ncbi:MAG TPA: hypothetical protein VIJ46_02505 [Rhabdochlamydiaceae bacterium]